MSIFGIIGISFAIGMIIGLIVDLIVLLFDVDDKWLFIIPVIIAVIVTIVSTFIGIGFTTESAREYRASFEAQKAVIEQSLELDSLSGLERIDLVTKAAELNGNMAARLVSAERWHVVFYDDTIYDGVELIKLDGGKES